MTNIEYANSLRQIADFYEANPDMKQPGYDFLIFTYERKEFLDAAKVLSRGGKVEKSVDGETQLSDYHAKRTFGAVTIDLRIPRKTICRLVRPAEYECPDSLLEEATEYSEAVL